MTAGKTSLAVWLKGFSREAAEEAAVSRFVETVDAAIRSQMPIFDADPVLLEDLHRSTRHQWLAFLSVVEQPQHHLLLPPQAHDLARSLARRGHDLGALLKVYRAAHNGIFAFFTTVVDDLGEDAPPRDEVLKLLWERTNQWVDGATEMLIETFYDERQDLHEGAMARRAEMIESVLQGDVDDIDEATRVLSHPLLQWQVGCVLWAREATSATTDAMLQTAGELADAIGASRPLIRVAGSRDIWIWIATPSQPDLTGLRVVQARLAERGLHLAVGQPARGIGGFRSSHAEARAAQHLCADAPLAPPLVDYREVELLCLAAGSGELLRRMVHREVGALAGADKNLAAVRTTALRYLSNGMNVEATAEELFVHKNTVRYRLARAEELLGHPLAQRGSHVELALRYIELFGPPAR